MREIKNLKDYKSLIKKYESRANKELAKYTCKLFMGRMKSEENRLICFSEFEKIIEEGGDVNTLRKELRKAHTHAKKIESVSRSHLSAIAPLTLSRLMVYLLKDLEEIVKIYAKNDGHDLAEIYKKVLIKNVSDDSAIKPEL